VAQELIRLRVSPPVYSGRYVEDGVVHTVSPEEFRQKRKELGEATRTALEKLFSSDRYQRMSDEEKAAEAAWAIAAARRDVLGESPRSRGPRHARRARQARR
jgi:thymidylate synthase ThyX